MLLLDINLTKRALHALESGDMALQASLRPPLLPVKLSLRKMLLQVEVLSLLDSALQEGFLEERLDSVEAILDHTLWSSLAKAFLPYKDLIIQAGRPLICQNTSLLAIIPNLYPVQ